MSTFTKTLLSTAFLEAINGGTADLGGGLYLQSGEALVREQEDWADEDPCKWINFAESDIWLLTDAQEPESMSSVEALHPRLIELGWEEVA